MINVCTAAAEAVGYIVPEEQKEHRGTEAGGSHFGQPTRLVCWAHRPALTRKVHLPETTRSKQSSRCHVDGEKKKGEDKTMSREHSQRETTHRVKTYIGLITKYIVERTKHIAVRLPGCSFQNASCRQDPLPI